MAIKDEDRDTESREDVAVAQVLRYEYMAREWRDSVLDQLSSVKDEQRTAKKELVEKITTVEKELSGKISAVEKEIGDRISAVEKELGGKISAVEVTLGKIDERFNSMVSKEYLFNALSVLKKDIAKDMADDRKAQLKFIAIIVAGAIATVELIINFL